MSNYVSLKDVNGKYYHVKVPSDVYTYIRQLEIFIKYPEESGLKEAYKGRFLET